MISLWRCLCALLAVFLCVFSGCMTAAIRPLSQAEDRLRRVVLPDIEFCGVPFLDAIAKIQDLEETASRRSSKMEIIVDCRGSIVKRGTSVKAYDWDVSLLVDEFRRRHPQTYISPGHVTMNARKISLWNLLELVAEFQGMVIEPKGSSIIVKPLEQKVYICEAYKVGGVFRDAVDFTQYKELFGSAETETAVAYVRGQNVLVFLAQELFQERFEAGVKELEKTIIKTRKSGLSAL